MWMVRWLVSCCFLVFLAPSLHQPRLCEMSGTFRFLRFLSARHRHHAPCFVPQPRCRRASKLSWASFSTRWPTRGKLCRLDPAQGRRGEQR
ncbi:hypothetical protein B0T18DRAFT_416658 [Schizothecium vesticola]|uniref:Secreted protein n=1 Tax=Schizothecium vesticola TaxID=314040 RepID=A0AA40K3B8_9PEZI|nr:hypothetical protein B0T18DRAFT_416658 [Schizothecium vesticola]